LIGGNQPIKKIDYFRVPFLSMRISNIIHPIPGIPKRRNDLSLANHYQQHYNTSVMRDPIMEIGHCTAAPISISRAAEPQAPLSPRDMPVSASIECTAMDLETASLLMMMLRSSPSGAAPSPMATVQMEQSCFSEFDDNGEHYDAQHSGQSIVDDDESSMDDDMICDSDSDYNPSHSTAAATGRRRACSAVVGRRRRVQEHGRRGRPKSASISAINERPATPSAKYGKDLATTAKAVIIDGRRGYLCPYEGCGRTFPSRAHGT
jgi:hypothetical protein